MSVLDVFSYGLSAFVLILFLWTLKSAWTHEASTQRDYMHDPERLHSRESLRQWDIRHFREKPTWKR